MLILFIYRYLYLLSPKSYKFINRIFRNRSIAVTPRCSFSFIRSIYPLIYPKDESFDSYTRSNRGKIRKGIFDQADDHRRSFLCFSLSLSSPPPISLFLHEWQTCVSLPICITYRSTVTTRISLLSLLFISLFLTLLLAYLSFLIISLTFHLHGGIIDFFSFSFSFLHSPFQLPHLSQILFCPLLQTIYFHLSSTSLFHSTYSIKISIIWILLLSSNGYRNVCSYSLCLFFLIFFTLLGLFVLYHKITSTVMYFE